MNCSSYCDSQRIGPTLFTVLNLLHTYIHTHTLSDILCTHMYSLTYNNTHTHIYIHKSTDINTNANTLSAAIQILTHTRVRTCLSV